MQIPQRRPPACKTADKNHHCWTSADWYWEHKWDGHRAVLYKDADGIRFLSRRVSDVHGQLVDNTGNLAYLVEELDFIPDGTIIDGELMGPNAIGQDSNYVTRVLRPKTYAQAKAVMDAEGYLIFKVFDMPMFAGEDRAKMPAEDRKAALEELLLANPCEHLSFSESLVGDPREEFERATSIGMEGLVAKYKKGPYEWAPLSGHEKRSKWWLKVKAEDSADCVVIGYTLPDETAKNTKGEIVPNQFYVKGWISGIVLGQYHTEPFSERALRELLSGYREWRTTFDEVLEYIKNRSFVLDGQIYHLHPVGVSIGMDFKVRESISTGKEKHLGKVVEIKYNKRFPAEAGIPAFRHPRFQRFRDTEKHAEDAIYRADES